MAGLEATASVQWRNEFGRFASAIEAGAERSQEEASEIGAALAAALAPKKKGTLAGSIHSNGHGFATGDLPEALPQEEGAAPHEIPNSFGWGITLEHPGNPAVHYMRDALKLVNSRIMGIVRGNMP